MGEWYIYGVNGSVKATVKKLEYSGEFMGETSVTCDVYSPSPISFSVGDYLSYRGESFVIDYDATRKKQSRINTYGNGFVYEGMKFTSYVGELKKCDFLDFVLNDNLQHYSQLPTFDFYAETVEALAERLQANLNRIYTGAKAWTVTVASGFEGKENINVQISKIKCLDALRIAYDQFDAQFVIRGRHIYIGTAGSSIATNFKYGKGNGLKSIERSVDESDGLVTRLRAYGNTTNLPANYYANKGRGCYAPIYEVYGIYTKGADIHFKPKFANNWFTEKSVSSSLHYWVSVSLDKILWMDALVSTNVSNTPDFSVVSVADAYGNNTPEMWAAFKTQLQSATQNTRLYFSKGVNYSNWKSEWKETDAYMPDMMSIDRLMLPGFPDEYTDPYLDSDNISTLGVREKSVYFDGSDDELPDIHPSMEGMTAQQLIDAGYTIDLDSGDNGNLDEIAADATEKDGSAITTDGAFVEVNEVPGFKVTIKDIGFDINSYLSGETATLSMKTGMCGGRDFNITKVTKVGNKYVLECQRVEDVNRFFPYNPYTIKAGDKFVLTGIEMPDAYIDAASQRLLTAAQEYLAKHSVPEWVYAIKMDDIWLQRQRDNSVSESASYYWNIKEGDIMTIQDTDLGIDVSEVIDRLSIREGYDPLPTFEVVLRKEKPQGTIGKLQNRIKSLERQNNEQAQTIIRQQSYIELVLGDRINDIQEQVDNAQVTYFYEGVPTLSNYPASEWDVASYPDHVHDMYYDKTTGKAYEFDISGSTYAWSLIQDEDIVRALADASTAQDTADGKRRVFVTAAGTLPTPPYDAGDMWVNATYPSNSTATNTSGNNPLNYTYYNDILKCVTPREGGDATANIGDWRLASKYTDDSSLNAFVSGTYQPFVTNIQNQVDKKAETWRQSTDPSNAQGWVASEHVGDIWMDTSANGGKKTYIYQNTGTSSSPSYQWVAQDVPDAVFDEIDGKCAIYVTWGAWGNDLQEKDLFIPSANTTQGGATYKANKVYRCVDKDTPTFQEIAYTDDTQYNGFITKLIGSSGQTKDAAENAIAAIKHALNEGNTYNEGGLILSNLISLGTGNPISGTFTPWAGISGIYKTSETGTGYKGHGIAAWFGGGMVDGEVSQSATNAAKSLFRFDGSGYVAGGNLSWDKNGNVIIQGYSINATTLKVGDANVATQAMLDNFVSKAFFNRLFTAYDANGNAIVPNDTTTAISNLKLMVGTWTEQYLSALGLNSQGGGGGTGDVSHIKVSTNPDVYLDPDSDGIIDMSDYVSTIAERNIWNTANANINRLMARVPSATFNTGNELADKAFVNSSISTATATFRGTVTASNDTDAAAATALATISTKDLNDYAFVKVENTPQTGVDKYKRYKYNGTSWVYEYTLNNSSFTADQWNAINSGINTSLVTKLNGIAAGAQVNVIETVKVNGTELSISSKAVDITAVPLTIITGANNLKAIEGLSGTGFLKRTGNNTWALDTTVVLNTRTITAGNGLTGGGDLSENRTINVESANAAITVNADNIQLNVINDYTTTTNNTIIPLAAARGKDLNDRLAILEAMFTREGAGTAASPYVIKANYGLYTNQFLSSLGQNSQGGSGDFDEEQMWIALGTDVEEKVIDSSHIPDIASKYGYATQTWVANNFNKYTLPLATSGTRGGVQIGYEESGKNYAVKLSGEKMYVNVPWENTTYSAGTGISISSGTIINNGVRSITKHSTTAYDILLINTGGTIDYLDLSHQHSYWEILDKPTDLEGFGLTDELNALYVTALGTSGNYLTWTKNGSTSNITIPYATLANTATTAADTSNTLYLVGVTSEATTTLKRNTSISVKGSAFNAGSVTTTGNVSVGGTLGVIGATTLTGLLTANGNIVTGTSNGAYIQIGAIKLVYDSTNNALKVIKSDNTSANLYATGAVSALGANSSGGGGSTFDEEQMWQALDATNEVINTSHIPDMAGIYGYLKQSSLSGYVTSVKVGTTAYNPSSGVVSLPAYPTKVSQLTNDSGYVTSSGVTSVTLKAGTGISLDVDNTAITSTGTRTITNSGVRATTINGNYLRVNTNGTNADLTIPYATSAGSVAWGNVSGKPTTVSGYGITDAVFNISRQGDGILKYYVGSTANYLDFSHNHSYWDILDRPVDLEGFGLTSELDASYAKVSGTNATGTWGISVTGNALTATKLQTARTIWGQSFDGTANVGGNIYMSNNNSIYSLDSGNTNRELFGLTSYNNLSIGSGVVGAGGGTYIMGNSFVVRIGDTSSTGNALAINSSKDATLAGTLRVNGNKIYFGDTSHYVELNSTGFHFSHGVYSDGFMSALGANSGGGSGDFSEEQMWAALKGNTGTYADEKINANHIPDTSSLYGYLKSSSLSGYATQSWVTSQGYASASSLSNYLPLSGGTLAGTGDGLFTINRSTSGSTPWVKFMSAGTLVGYLGVDSSSVPRFHNGTTNYTLIHSGNIGSQSVNYATSAGSCSGNAATATSATTASKLSTVSKTAWGQTYWTSGGVPTTISGDMSNVGTIDASGNITVTKTTTASTFITVTNSNGSASLATGTYRGLYDNTTTTWIIGTNGTNTWLSQGNVGIGTTSPSYKLDVNGTFNASGNASVGGNISVSGTATIGSHVYMGFGKILYMQNSESTNQEILVINSNDNLRIGYGIRSGAASVLLYSGSGGIVFRTAGTNTATASIDASGNFTATGEVTASSDARKKNIVSNTKFNVRDIASARSVLYEWNDGRDKYKKVHGGSIAQDWLGKADSFLSQDSDGWYSINYGALALCSAITIAREVVKHEDRITMLEKENAKLKARIAELEERRVA